MENLDKRQVAYFWLLIKASKNKHDECSNRRIRQFVDGIFDTGKPQGGHASSSVGKLWPAGYERTVKVLDFHLPKILTVSHNILLVNMEIILLPLSEGKQLKKQT